MQAWARTEAPARGEQALRHARTARARQLSLEREQRARFKQLLASLETGSSNTAVSLPSPAAVLVAAGAPTRAPADTQENAEETAPPPRLSRAQGAKLAQLAALNEAQGRATSFAEYFWENRQRQLEADLEARMGALSTSPQQPLSPDGGVSTLQMVGTRAA